MKHEFDLSQQGIARMLVYHLMPGVAIMASYLLVLKVNLFGDWPRIVVFGIIAAIMAILVQLGMLMAVARKEKGTYDVFSIIGFRRKDSLTKLLITSLALLLVVGALFASTGGVSERLFNLVFHLDKEVFDIAQDMNQFSKGIVLTAIIVTFFSTTLIAPVIEELYFRGFLLARMKHLKVKGVLINSLLFAVYHFWSPWLILTRFVALTPLFYFVYKKESIWLGIIVHCLANFMTVVELAVVFSKMQ